MKHGKNPTLAQKKLIQQDLKVTKEYSSECKVIKDTSEVLEILEPGKSETTKIRK
ncbi:MAG TPA: hypothetical protein VD757_01690 [Candidatus Nitrosocosmicus sp.]|nr:hypothetical protein [Candidatus Nitrosocosmicus sp.]